MFFLRNNPSYSVGVTVSTLRNTLKEVVLMVNEIHNTRIKKHVKKTSSIRFFVKEESSPKIKLKLF